MNRFAQSIGRASSWLLRHAGAGISLGLIVLALIIGFMAGHSAAPSGHSSDASAEAPDGAGAPTMYTCSMHPSVRLTDPNAKCPICFMDLIPVADNASSGLAPGQLALSEAARAASVIETAVVSRFFPNAEVRLYGKVTYDETSVARLTAYFPGRIERLFVNYVGVPVEKGDHMAEVYSPELLAAFEELRQASTAVDRNEAASDLVREATIDTLTASREKLRLFGLTPAQVDAVETGAHDSDRLTIYSPIRGVVTHLSAREGDYLNTGEAIATVADLSRLWLDLEAYESQLPLVRWGQPVSFTVEAHPGETFEGRVSFIEPMVDERTRTAAVRVAVDNADGRLKPGMFASAVVRPRVAAGGAVVSDDLAGRWVSPMHPTIVKDGPGQCDICGMDLVPAESLGVVSDPASFEAPLIVPRSAVMFTGTRSVVYVEIEGTKKPTYEGREVTLGPRAGEFYVIRDGLREGERVVVHGAFRVDSAMQIAAKPSMMSERDGGETARDRVPDPFVFSLKPVYAAYLDAQEALADDALDRYRVAESDLQSAIGLVDAEMLVGEALGDWRRAAALLRQERDAESIESARERFERMSEGVIGLLERFGHHGVQTWRLAHCPMAFDFKGADWVQRGEEIDNPYFGASMLRCGEIQGTFEPLDVSDAAPAPTGGHRHD